MNQVPPVHAQRGDILYEENPSYSLLYPDRADFANHPAR